MPAKKAKTTATPELTENVPANSPDNLPANWNYESTMAHIELITQQLETGELPLAEVFEQFSEAVSALQQCDRFLQDKQEQASLLIETLVGDESETGA